MDETDLVKVGTDAALAPVREFINKVAGPFADEVGGILGDRARVWRFKRAVRLLEKVKRICEETGFEPKAVPLKTLLPILESASLEDDEDLHDRWAALLANATLNGKTFHPSFPLILGRLSISEAKFLDRLFDFAISEMRKMPIEATAAHIQMLQRMRFDALGMMFAELQLTPIPWAMTYGDYEEYGNGAANAQKTALAKTLDNLIALGLISAERTASVDHYRFERQLEVRLEHETTYQITALGFEFVTACRRPKGAAAAEA